MSMPEGYPQSGDSAHLSREQIFDVGFTQIILRSVGHQLRQYGRPRIQLSKLGISSPKTPLDGVIDRSWSSVETMQKLAGLSDETVEPDLDLAAKLLHGLAVNLTEHNHARINLRLMGVDDPVRSTDFAGQVQSSFNTLGNIISAQ